MRRLRYLSLGETIPPSLHIPEEEPQEESDGVLQFLSLRSVPPRTAKLHRS